MSSGKTGWDGGTHRGYLFQAIWINVVWYVKMCSRLLRVRGIMFQLCSQLSACRHNDGQVWIPYIYFYNPWIKAAAQVASFLSVLPHIMKNITCLLGYSTGRQFHSGGIVEILWWFQRDVVTALQYHCRCFGSHMGLCDWQQETSQWWYTSYWTVVLARWDITIHVMLHLDSISGIFHPI